MSKQSKKWFQNLPLSKQLLFFFVFWWFMWLGGSIMEEKLFSAEPRSAAGHIFFATCMSFFMSIVFNWPKVKSVFRKQRSANN